MQNKVVYNSSLMLKLITIFSRQFNLAMNININCQNCQCSYVLKLHTKLLKLFRPSFYLLKLIYKLITDQGVGIVIRIDHIQIWLILFFVYLPYASFQNKPWFAIFDLLIVNSYKIVVHLQVAKSELSGQFQENSGFKRKRGEDYVKQMSSDLNICKRERHKREKNSSLQ